MYRVYFNRELEWPQCWSVDEGDQSTEINVTGFEVNGCRIESRTLTKEERAGAIRDRLNRPYAWFAVDGWLTVKNGRAIFHP